MSTTYHQTHQESSPTNPAENTKKRRHRAKGHKKNHGPPPHILALGPWLRLVSDETIASELGLSVRSVRGLFRVLQLPTLELPTYGRLRFVDFAQFTIAMKAVLRIGQPDFTAPGCRSLIRAARSTPLRQNTTARLTTKALRQNLTPILTELALQQWSATYKSKDQALQYAARACRHLLDASIHLSATRHQAQQDAIALRQIPKTPHQQAYDAWLAPIPDPGPDA